VSSFFIVCFLLNNIFDNYTLLSAIITGSKVSFRVITQSDSLRLLRHWSNKRAGEREEIGVWEQYPGFQNVKPIYNDLTN